MADHPLLQPVKAEHRFFLPDGTSIRSLKELATSLSRLPDHFFKHHVNQSKNDFHAWVSHVVRDTHLSKELKDVRDQRSMTRIVNKRVAELEARDARKEISSAIENQKGTSGDDSEDIKTEAPPLPATIAHPSFFSRLESLVYNRHLQPVAANYQHPKAAPVNTIGVQAGMFKELPVVEQEWMKLAKSSPKEEKRPAQNAPTSSVGGLKPLRGEKRARPLIEGAGIPKGSPSTVITTISGKDSDGYIEEELVGEPERDDEDEAPVKLAVVDEEGKDDDLADSEMPEAPKSFYAKKPATAGESCDHNSHFSCVRCGMMEFGVGLAVGILATLMIAKAFL